MSKREKEVAGVLQEAGYVLRCRTCKGYLGGRQMKAGRYWCRWCEALRSFSLYMPRRQQAGSRAKLR